MDFIAEPKLFRIKFSFEWLMWHGLNPKNGISTWKKMIRKKVSKAKFHTS